ncbi:hypothetical protein [Wenyingzhuangia sp. 2_MG-2023]|uniref:hypothetical protein n=1 Tax=Wenyingzhuangia sp. 2_MG-2023 TaxID=3062639 RepID=UPI0026E16398|nr:hypothetical protein [Wenyingzhuangia sp. 2_MG-2023]MDO6738788.1 hypothetical protein [Wenyingzhuangia sp. 2_MG-2023]MDO6801963.1 hypothetical protein [Wenyingzhuangia sp. 1_MG-2023]
MLKFKTDLSKEDFKDLAQTTDFNCVSIYCPILSHIKVSRENFIFQIHEVEQRLLQDGVPNSSAQNILNPLEYIANNDSIWNAYSLEQSKTFVIFINENSIQSYLINTEIDSCMYITTNYYLLPLIKKASSDKLLEDTLKIKKVMLDKDVTTNRLEKVIPLAMQGKIERLYVSASDDVFGVYDEINQTTIIDNEMNSTNMSLINFAAITTYQRGGDVFLVDNPLAMPVKGVPIQAIIKEEKETWEFSTLVDPMK